MSKITTLFLAAVCLVSLTAASLADEITDQIDKGKSLYSAQKYSPAIQELNFAVGQIQNKLADLYKTALPNASAGWEADDAESQSAGLAFMGGGISVKRHFYKNEGASVDVEVVSDSPLLSSVMMMYGNPMFLGGNKLVTVKGEKAVEEWNESDKSGKLSLVIESRILVTISGSSLASKDDLYTYANATDIAKLKAILKE